VRPSFDITVREAGRAVVVAARGELDLLSGPELVRAVAEALDGKPELRIDLGGLTFIDVAGVRAVWQAVQRAQAVASEVRVSLGPAPVRRVFELCGVREAAGGRLHSSGAL
jgi:anti-sigma B factor antagonist